MTWAELTIDAERVKGLAKQRLINRSTNSFDLNEINGERTQAAKDLVWRKMRDRKVGRLSQYIDGYPSATAMLNAIAAHGDLAADVADMLSLAFLVIYVRQRRNSNRDVYADDAKMFEEDLDAAVRAFSETAPYVLGQVSNTGHMPGGGALSSIMSTYD